MPISRALVVSVLLPKLVLAGLTQGSNDGAMAWSILEAHRFVRSDGAMAIYDSMRRQVARPGHGAGGS